MTRTIGLALTCSVGLLLAGCAAGTGAGITAGETAAAQGAAAPSAGAALAAEAAGPARDFNLRVKCPGIHLEKTRLNWSDGQIMAHENVTHEQIAECEAWSAARPKGYVPPLSPSSVSKGSTVHYPAPQQAEPAGPPAETAH